MTAQQNIALGKRLYDEVFNKGNLSVCDEIIANNVKINDPAMHNGHTEGLKAFKDAETQYKKAFPNKKITIDDIFANEDKVVVRWTCQGVHKGELQGIAPTNRSFKISGISIYQVANGKITSAFQFWDRLGLLEQIGEIQPALALH